MLRKGSLVFLGAAAGVALTLIAAQSEFVLFAADAKPVTAAETYQRLDALRDAFEWVRSRYVEKPDDNKLVESAIGGMLSELEDSSYIDSKSLSDMTICTASGSGCQFGTVGVELTLENDFVKVLSSIDDTPAAKAGVMTGDIITRLDNEPVQGLTLDQTARKLRGAVGTKVRLKIVHAGQNNPVDILITRGAPNPRQVRWRSEGGDIGYIRMTTFNEPAADGLKRTLNDIATQIAPETLRGYVLDLRNNPVGLLDQAIAVADAFLDTGEIVSIYGRTMETKHVRAQKGDLINGKRLIVLINGGSAAMAEVVAGALQDNRRATIVGTRSFGKGSVYTLIPVRPEKGAIGGDGGVIRLATGHYFTPSGRMIQRNGISPDVEVLQSIPDDLKVAKDREQPRLQSYIPPDPKDDKALNKAFDLLRGANANVTSQPVKATVPN
jgi:carboxyl-terminal processing protease